MALSQHALTACLVRLGIMFRELDLGHDLTLVVSVAGGRVFGPFLNGLDALGWSLDEPGFEAALLAGDWNIGGERVWLAPERHFNFTDPARMLETYRVAPELDPGVWNLATEGDGVVFDATPALPRTDQGAPIRLRIVRHIRPLNRSEYPALPQGVIAGGYRQTLEVTQPQSAEGLAIVPWLIRQVALGGEAILSASGRAPGECVFGMPPHAAITPQSAAWRVPFGPRGFFKTSYTRHSIASGGLSYLIVHEGQATAVIMRPHLAAPDCYPETLPHNATSQGHAAALFRDDGRFGRYGELELYGHTDGRARGTLVCDTLILMGGEPAVRATIDGQATEISSISIS